MSSPSDESKNPEIWLGDSFGMHAWYWFDYKASRYSRREMSKLEFVLRMEAAGVELEPSCGRLSPQAKS